MDKILIDSHIFIWLLQEPDKIGPKSHNELVNTSKVYVSLASIWEFTIKYQKGKFDFSPQKLLKAIKPLGAELLPITDQHIVETLNIKTNHNDPFDRLLLAQAKAENIELLTADTSVLLLNLPYVMDARL